MADDPGQITALLRAHRDGDEAALDEVLALLYHELQMMARRLRPRADGHLQTGTLLHEAYLKLGRGQIDVRDREHFRSLAVRAMRQVAVDHARTRLRGKRGGGARHQELEEARAVVAPSAASPEAVLSVQAILQRIEAERPRLARVVECRFFAGMNEAETAECLGISMATVQRDWRSARDLLRERMREGAVAPEDQEEA